MASSLHSLHFHFLSLLLLVGIAPELNKAEWEHPVLLDGFPNYRSSRPNDYTWGWNPSKEQVPWVGSSQKWIRAEASAIPDPNSFATLSQELPAESFRGYRVEFSGSVRWKGLTPGVPPPMLFIRVVTADDTTVAFDDGTKYYPEQLQTMSRQGTTGVMIGVLVAVDVPPFPETCLPPEDLPAFIQCGLLLRGGSGYAEMWDTAADETKIVASWERRGGPPWEPHPWVHIAP